LSPATVASKGLPRTRALAELAAELGNARVKPGSAAAANALTAAASMYVIDGEPAQEEWRYCEALALLARARADEDAARRARAAPGGLRMLGQG
jgi:hypothetical protein